jgi:hypothetical protein
VLVLGINKHKNKIKTCGEVYADSAYANKKNDGWVMQRSLLSRSLKTHSNQTKPPPFSQPSKSTKLLFIQHHKKP